MSERLRRVERKLDHVLYRLYLLTLGASAMSAELDQLEAQVKKVADAEDSAILLLNGLHDLLVAAGTDPAKLKKLADDLAAGADKLGAAVAANAPPAPVPPTP